MNGVFFKICIALSFVTFDPAESDDTYIALIQCDRDEFDLFVVRC